MIKVKNLRKSYKDKEVLKSVSFSVEEKEIMGMIGLNGSGKSTLVEILCGIKKFDDGEVLINGLSVDIKKNKNKLNRLIGYMSQSFCMFNDLTVYENLAYVCTIYDIRMDEIDKVIKLCYLEEYRNTLASNLSGGYKQLLSLSALIIHNPAIYILDEPTSAMDPVFRRKFWKVIKSCNKKGVTVLLITHYLEELLECDKFVLLDKGMIRYNGSVDQFRNGDFINIEDVLKKYNKRNANEQN